MSNAPSIEFPITVTGDTCLIELPTYITVLEAVALQTQCQALFEAEPAPKRVILDFGKTEFVDSSGIGALVTSTRLAQTYRIEFSLWSVQPQIEAMFSMLSLDQLFKIEDGTQSLSPQLDPKPAKPPAPHPSVQSVLKRSIDIVGALVGLSITGIVFLPIAIAIQINDPGAIFFRQTRCGIMGKRFRLWKFRSMVSNAELLKGQVQNQVEGPMFKNANDPRITAVGRFLRKTSLDELPQFWNVLMGDMSLVGTRPPTPDELDRYEIPSWQRLNVKPGMTGEWQVYGRSTVTKFEDVIQLDLRYQERWSLNYDLKLIVQTILVLFTKRSGAY